MNNLRQPKIRTASYSIKGFLYQFLKTLLVVLNSNDGTTITIEGIIEDIDVTTNDRITAIQCKYHESARKVTLSGIYSPLLQMMKHYQEHNDKTIEYILFIHDPGYKSATLFITENDVKTILNSQDKSLKNLINDIPDCFDLNGFLSKFRIEYGPSFDQLEMQIISSFENNGVIKSDAKDLFYPNAIQLIASLSTKHITKERTITKTMLLDKLKNMKAVLLTRWTQELISRKKLLDTLNKQLKTNLSFNVRERWFLINSDGYEDFEQNVIKFIKGYIYKYHHKPLHKKTPLFCIRTDMDTFYTIQERLRKAGIKMADGYTGRYFSKDDLFRDPLIIGKKSDRKVEFDIRIMNWGFNKDCFEDKTPDDIYIVGKDCFNIKKLDASVFLLDGVSFKELNYVLGVNNER